MGQFRKVALDDPFRQNLQDHRTPVPAPGKTAEIITLPNTLKAKQEFVGGFIEATYPSADPIAVICNEEGKLIGLTPNRRLGDDILCGVFYVVADDGDGELTSLTKEQIKVYTEMFFGYENIPPDELANSVFIKFFPEV